MSSPSSSPFPSKPLHNFDLPSLKWNKEPKPSNRRRSAKSPTRILESSKIHNSKKTTMLSLEREREDTVDRFQKKPIKGSSKIVLKLPSRNKNNDETTNDKVVKEEIHDDSNNKGENEDDDDAKTWNLRPRRPLVRKCAKNVDVNAKSSGFDNKGKSQVMLGENDGEGEKEKEKVAVRVNVSLTKEEIEEDMFAFTGLKTARRPKKRHRNVQKRLDYMFPGLGLVSVTPDTYKVTENSTKG